MDTATATARFGYTSIKGKAAPWMGGMLSILRPGDNALRMMYTFEPRKPADEGMVHASAL